MGGGLEVKLVLLYGGGFSRGGRSEAGVLYGGG